MRGQLYGDMELAGAAMRTILSHGSLGVLTACAGWASVVAARLFERERLDEYSLGFEVWHRRTGEIVDPDSITDPDMVARVWAVRFISAVANNDLDAAYALFKVSAEATGPVGYGPFALLEMTARIIGGEGNPPLLRYRDEGRRGPGT